MSPGRQGCGVVAATFYIAPLRATGSNRIRIANGGTAMKMSTIRWLMTLASLLGLLGAGSAQAQKKLVVYTSNESTLNDLVFGAFKKETGIEVEPVAAGSGVVIRRLQAEKARPLGDIIWGISRSLLQTNVQYLDSYASQHKDAVPVEYRDPQDRWIGTNLHLLVVLQNTKSVPEAEGPKSWEDLIAAKWKGNIASPIRPIRARPIRTSRCSSTSGAAAMPAGTRSQS